VHLGSFIYQCIRKPTPVEYGPVRLFYQALVSDPKSYCVNSGDAGSNIKLGTLDDIRDVSLRTGINVPDELSELPQLQECACPHFNRFTTNRRQELEAKAVADIVANNPNKKTRLELVSLGAGEGLQDFILIGLLANEGYSNIHLSLIDSSQSSDNEGVVGDPIVDGTCQNLKDFYAQMPSLNISVDGFTSTTAYCNANTSAKPHAVWAADLEVSDLFSSKSTWNDVMALRGRLQTGGHIYLTDPVESLSFSKTDIEVIYGGKSVGDHSGEGQTTRYETIQGHLHRFKRLETLNMSYYCRSTETTLSGLLPFLIGVKNLGLKNIQIKIVFPDRSRDDNKQKTLALLNQVFSNQLFPGMNVQLIDSENDEQKIHLRIKEKHFLIDAMQFKYTDNRPEETMASNHLILYFSNTSPTTDGVTLEGQRLPNLRQPLGPYHINM